MSLRDKIDKAFETASVREPGPSSSAKPMAKQTAQAPPTNPPPPWQPFPVDVLPEPVRTFVAKGAAAIGSDVSMIGLPALAVCAGAIGTTRQVRLKRTWAEPCVVWLAVVAKSGTLKSPAQDYALRPLHDAQLVRLREYEAALAEYRAAMIRYEADLSQWKRAKAKDRGEQPQEPQAPLCVRYVVAETTIEALAPILLANPRGVLLARDELAAWLTGFNQYKPKGGSDAAAWLEMQRAGTVIVDRKTGAQRTIFVPRAAVSVCGTIQPGTIERLLTREFFEAGLPARLLLAAPPQKQKRWTDADVSADIVARFAELVGTLLALEHDTDEAGELVPVDVPLSPGARNLWTEWYDANAATLAKTDDDDLSAVHAKIEGYAARLALVIHSIRCAASPTYPGDAIEANSMADGITLARWFAHEAERVYGIWRESDEARADRRIVELIRRKGGRITPRELCQSSREFRGSSDDAERALNRLVSAGVGRWLHDDHGGGRGRPGRVFELSAASTVYENPVAPMENANSVDVDNPKAAIRAALRGNQ